MRPIDYYPGCSLVSSGREMQESFEAVAQAFGHELKPLQDWSCCGSTPAHSISHDYAFLFPAQNLVLAERQGVRDLMVLCPSCYVRLWDARRAVLEDEEKNKRVERLFGQRLRGTARPQFFVETLQGFGLDAMKEKASRPLQGMKAALYYGCLLSRQEWITGFDVEPYRGFLQELIGSLGAEAVPFALERQCCGAGLAVTKPEMSDRMVDRIHDFARRSGANCLVVFCPLCHMNLELRGKADHLPVLYITEAMSLAMGSPHAKVWLGKHLVDPQPLLSELRIA